MSEPAGQVSGAQMLADLPDPEYRAIDALSQSGAKRLLPPGCPALFRHEQLHGRPERATFDYGHAAHQMVLGVGAPVIAIEAADWRTTAAKAERDDAYEKGWTPLLRKDYERVRAMARALQAHPVTGALFDPERGRAELSITWHDEWHDVDRKARLDWLLDTGERLIVVDYKSAVCAAPSKFARDVAGFGYHQQADWYREAVAVVTDGATRPPFIFVVQEKEPPYLVGIYELDDDALILGRERNADALALYADCLAHDTWPAYTDNAITRLSLPGWAYR